MNVLIRGVRVIDPARGVDAAGQDVRIEQGMITAVGRGLDSDALAVLDMTPAAGGEWRVLCPGFTDLHAHLREPGGEEAETIESGARAAAAGGFTQVFAMANTTPPVDSPARVAEARRRGANACVGVHSVAALSLGLAGRELVDVEACAAAGAAAFSDDGRNALRAAVLAEGLRRAAAVGRSILVHPEDEHSMAHAGAADREVVRSVDRPARAEVDAVAAAIRALRDAGAGALHLQHISTAASVELLRAAKGDGLRVTAEVTPHHLAFWAPSDGQPSDDPLRKVNPPLRAREDRDAVRTALLDGVIDAVATDHAPHPAREKTLGYSDAAPGMTGLETALATCITLGDLGGPRLPLLVSRLTTGPESVLPGVAEVSPLRAGVRATCVLFDPGERWVVGDAPVHSRSRNTPLMGMELRGRVLLVIRRGEAVYRDSRLAVLEAAGV